MSAARRTTSTTDHAKANLTDRRQFLEALAAAGGGAVVAACTPPLLGAAEGPPEAAAPGNAQRGRGAAGLVREAHQPSCLEASNGWYLQDGKVIWGYAQQGQWWGGYRGQPTGWWTDTPLSTCITRNAPGEIGPNRTEDLGPLTDSMLAYGYPGYEHVPPLWYDRRRDAHDRGRRNDGNVVGPTLEMPWARSDQGQAWDGLPLYDLTKYNPWYFARLKEFADLCDRKGCILFFDFYLQHNLLESPAHYVDFPWRPVNCLQATEMPDTLPAANAFYDVTHPLRRKLHQQYIWHCLDTFRDNRNVVLLTNHDFTGPLRFMQFWFDTILQWEQRSGRKTHIGLGATKDVVDAMLQDPRYAPRIATIDLRYWYFTADDSLYAPPGGKEVPSRYTGGAGRMTPLQIYRQVSEYRLRYPQKAILHAFGGDQANTMAFLMAGGSMLLRGMGHVREYPSRYEMPLNSQYILPVYPTFRMTGFHFL